MTIQDIESRLEQLRFKWKTHKGSREIIRRQARALIISKELILRKTPQTKLI